MGELQAPVTVTQQDPDKLHVKLGHDNALPIFKTLAHGALVTIWTPETGNHLHIKSMLISAAAKGYLILYHDEAPWARLEFGDRKVQPIGFAGELNLGTDMVLKGTFTADDTSASAYITVLGHEES